MKEPSSAALPVEHSCDSMVQTLLKMSHLMSAMLF